MVIDTGTTLLTGPTKDVKKLLSMVSVSPKCSNFYDMPSITFIMQGQKYILKAEDYVLTITGNLEIINFRLGSGTALSTFIS